MASAINNGAFTFNPEEIKDWSEVINELTFADPDLNAIHDIQQGIKYDEQIVFAGKIGLMGKKVGANCAPNEISGISLTEKFWNPVFEDFRLTHCSTDVNTQDKLVNQMARMNPDYRDVVSGSNSSTGNFLVGKVIDGFNETILRKAWFNDTAADTVVNGGVLTNGTDKEFFNSFDGIFKQMFVEIPDTDSKYVSIPKNGRANYEDQELTANESIAILKAMYKKADSRLLSDPNKKFYVTRTIWDGYLDDLEDIQNQGAGNTLINEEGKETLRYRGVEVVKMEIWDRIIEDFENNGTTYNLPHRAVLTTPLNIPIGTLSQDDWGTLDAFYDKVTAKNYIDGIYSLDSKFMQKYLAIFAY
jgi:hypothetical protein